MENAEVVLEQTQNAPEPVQQPEVTEPETSPPKPDAEQPNEAASAIKRMERRIARTTAAKYDAEARARQAATEAEALKQRLAQYETQDSQPQQFRPEDVLTLAERIAAQRLEQQQVVATVKSVLAEGKSLENFDSACNAVNEEIPFCDAMGEPTPFLKVVMETDAPAKVLHYLGTHLDTAEELAGLSQTQLARRLARIEADLGKPVEVKPTSAPAPIEPVRSSGGGGLSKDPSAMSDREFAEWRKRQIAQRR